MATFFLIVSIILFIATFGIHMAINSGDQFDRPMYTRDPIMSAIPWVSGFILPVIPFTIIFEYHWVAVFFINLAVVYILGPILTKVLLVRFASGKGLGHDMLYSFLGGIVALIIGLLAR
ncbi:hypothetical protein [Emticicia agri]|uniref:Uncharacterized protein n=1 Tax=Emticicia agri TaxID=2492393 RepID=A0A4Q5LU56_9BACT|nr:hypothetical protein [Emticicia agri]RYU93181.1 hypothetical protein EWM59_23405 [Emticicia agri]